MAGVDGEDGPKVCLLRPETELRIDFFTCPYNLVAQRFNALFFSVFIEVEHSRYSNNSEVQGISPR